MFTHQNKETTAKKEKEREFCFTFIKAQLLYKQVFPDVQRPVLFLRVCRKRLFWAVIKTLFCIKMSVWKCFSLWKADSLRGGLFHWLWPMPHCAHEGQYIAKSICSTAFTLIWTWVTPHSESKGFNMMPLHPSSYKSLKSSGTLSTRSRNFWTESELSLLCQVCAHK